jgi:hypothetical protein
MDRGWSSASTVPFPSVSFKYFRDDFNLCSARIQELSLVLTKLGEVNVKPAIAESLLSNHRLNTSALSSLPSIAHLVTLYQPLCELIPYAGSFDPVENITIGPLVVTLLLKIQKFFDPVSR